MKQQQKRVVSALLVLVMVLSLFSGLTVHVHAASYVYNWGTRGTTATELSDAAVAFYEKNQVTYEDLAAYTGSSSVSSVPSSTLYDELAELMESNHKTITSYDGTRELYRYTDCQNGGGTISSFYSGASIGPDWDSGKTWNREHTWPNSKGDASGQGENDIMMLRPTAVSENSSRGNTAYGESSGYYNPNSKSNGAYNLHGDVARIMLYVYTRWGNTTNMWGSSGVIESKEVLLKWIEEDPVDTWELGRNDAVQSITGTRNVFVDYPELAFVLFGTEVPDDMATPSGKAQNSVSYTITATANNANMGTVSVSGSKITATPTQGFAVSGYEVTSGTATVTQNGNIFTVKATSDCTIQINFEAAQQVSIAYMGNGVQVSSETAYTGDVMELPGYQGTVPGGYTFLGWTDTTVSHSDEKPEYYEAGDDYTVSGNATLHALFSYVVEGSGTAGAWTLVTDASQLAVGANVVVASVDEDYAMSTDQRSGYNRAAASITKTGNTITLGENVAKLTLGEGTVDNSWSFYCAANEGFLYAASDDRNNLQTGDLRANGSFTIDVQNDGVAKIVGQGGNSRNHLRFNSDNNPKLFSCYRESNTMKDVCLYIQASGSTKYTTSSCVHANKRDVGGLDATCTTPGYTAGIMCTDCNVYISGHEPISTLGHKYDKVVTPPTATEDGYTTYTCSVCGDTYTGDSVPALGETYTVSFSVPEGVTAIASMPCNNAGITLPEAGVPVDGYTFLGWTEAPVNSITDRPSYDVAGTKYNATSDITLHALYSYVAGGTGAGSYVLVENVNQLKSGSNVVIAAAEENVALGSYQKTSNRATGNISKSEKTITLGEGVAELILGEGKATNTWSFYCSTNNGYLYAGASDANQLKTKATLDEKGSFKIEIADGVATIKAQDSNVRNWLRYNNGDKTNLLFSCYEDSAEKGGKQQDVCLYIKSIDGTIYYTTGACDHTNTENVGGQDATCSEPGYTAGIRCVDCGAFISGHDEIPYTGHKYTFVVTPPTATEDGYTTYTCSSCGDIYTDDIVPALGATYTVSFSVPEGVTPVASMPCNKTGIILPAAAVPVDGYTFLGWTEAPVNNQTSKPTYYAARANYTATSDVTLYALYSYVVGGTGAQAYVLVENEGQLIDGANVVIAAADEEFAMSTDQRTGYNRAAAAITKSGNTITLGEGVAELVLGEGVVDGTWSFYCAANKGFLSAASNDRNNLQTGEMSANASFTINVENGGIAKIVGQGGNERNHMRFNSENDPKLFSCYRESSTTKHVCLYIQTADGTTYYTTEMATECAHTGGTATCKDQAICDLCHKPYGKVDPTNHTEITIPGKDATCTDTGLTEGKKCSVCGTTTVEQKEIPTKSHTEVTIPGKDVTCTDTGLTEGKKCSVCGTTTVEQKEIPTKSHTEVTIPGKDATCTDTGLTEGTKCSTCGTVTKAQETIPVLNHQWDAGEVTKEPTENAAGVRTYTCGTCGETKTESIPALGHTHKHEAVVTAPTCTERGYTTYTCSCGDSYKDNYVDAAGHKWDNGKVTKEPTETETGVRTYTCGTCGETKTESIPALGHTHKHEAKVTAPTCTEKGYTTYTCSCGDSYKDNYVDAAGHKITYVVQTEPTTEADGVLAGSCENCDHKTKIVLPKLNKESYTYEVIQQPTADEPGVGRYVWTTEYGTFSFDVALEQLQTVVLGDTDGNGKIQTNDAKLVLQYVVKMPATLNLDAADVDGNGKIQTNDAKLILQYVVKIITKFPAQNA